jgi:hypothetical protein
MFYGSTQYNIFLPICSGSVYTLTLFDLYVRIFLLQAARAAGRAEMFDEDTNIDDLWRIKALQGTPEGAALLASFTDPRMASVGGSAQEEQEEEEEKEGEEEGATREDTNSRQGGKKE